MNEMEKTERTVDTVTLEINTLHRQAQQMMLGYVIEIGRRLVEVKEMLPYGSWGTYLAQRTPYSQSTANNFMKIFQEYGDENLSLFEEGTKSQTFGKLSYTQALALLALPADEREAFSRENQVENMSSRQLQEAIKERNQAREEAERLKNAARDLEEAKASLANAEQSRAKMEEDMRLLNQRLEDMNQEAAQKDEELRAYFGIVLVSIVLIVWNLKDYYSTLGETIRHVAFQVSSIITTTGFATTDFDLWPSFSKTILLCLMVVGACAGSTGGGIKVARVLLLFKSLRRSLFQMLHPRRVSLVRNNGQPVDEKVVANTNAYLTAYVFILFGSFLLVSLDGFSTGTNFSAILCCFNNIGPGLEAVGPTCNFSQFSVLSKLVLIADMLLGRLEIFPIMVLFSRQTWKNL